MSTHNVTELVIRCEEGPETVSAAEAAPGLFVYELPAHVAVGYPNRWAMGVADGLLVAHFPDEEAATQAADDSSGLADWTAPAETLRGLFLDHGSTSLRARQLLWDAVTHAGGEFSQVGQTPTP